MKHLRFILAIAVCSTGVLTAADPTRLVHRWEREPDLGTSWQQQAASTTPGIQPDRLSSTLQVTRLNEVQSIIRNADNPRLQGGQQSLSILLEQLRNLPENRPARVSLAAAAIALAKSEHAEQLWELLRSDEATRPLIERALINWERPMSLELWRQRLKELSQDGPDLLLAIEGVGATGTPQDKALLEAAFRSDSTSTTTKLIIARAMGRVVPSGLEGLATSTLNSKLQHRELLAGELLAIHESDAAKDVLAKILKTEHLPAMRVAFEAIAKIDPVLARELAVEMLRRNDSHLRRKAVDVLNAHDDVESLRMQAVGLEDGNALVRNTVRENFAKKATLPQLRPVVDEVITFHLQGKSHKATEQAIMLAVALQQAERCPQLLSLLEYPQLDTTVYAAWALQELAVDPSVVESIYKFSEATTDRLKKGATVSDLEILRQSFLFEALGRNLYRPAVDSLKLYIPKDNHKMGKISRASAIWALGKILSGTGDQGVAKQLVDRMNDEDYSLLEYNLVRYNATVALGWIGAASSISDLKRVPYMPPEPLGISAQWAIKHLESSRITDQ